MSGRLVADGQARVALWGNFGSGNLGNEATLQALAHNLRRFLPRAELSCLCSVPEDTRRRHGLPSAAISPTRGRAAPVPGGRGRRLARAARRVASELGGWRDALREVRGLDLLLVAGTGLLTDEGEGPLGLPHEVFKWSLAARLAGTPHAFLSVGAEGVRCRISRLFLTRALRLASYLSFRDNSSRDAMAALGAPAGAPVYPDLAFSFPQHLIPQRDRDGRGGRLRTAVGLYDAFERGRAGDADREAYREYLDVIRRLVLWLLDRGHDVQLVIGDVAYDVPVLQDLCSLLGTQHLHRRGRLCAEPARTVEQLLGQLASVDLVVATRFHNLLLGFLLGHPAVAIAHQAKDLALLRAVGLEGRSVPLRQLELERLGAQFCALEAEAEGLRPAILGRAACFRAQLDEQYALLFGRGRLRC